MSGVSKLRVELNQFGLRQTWIAGTSLGRLLKVQLLHHRLQIEDPRRSLDKIMGGRLGLKVVMNTSCIRANTLDGEISFHDAWTGQKREIWMRGREDQFLPR